MQINFQPDSLPRMVRETFDLLVAEHGDKIERFHWDGHSLEYFMSANSLVCDFCSTRNGPYTTQRCRPVIIFQEQQGTESVSYASSDNWASCVECTPFITDGNKAGLFNRAVTLAVHRYGKDSVHKIRHAIRVAHNSFWSNH